MNNRTIRRLAVLLAGAVAAPVAASLPTPAPAAASTDSMAYLHHAGSGDVFEITTSMLALQKSQNSQLRDFATMLIDHHTQLTNAALVAAKAGAVMPPPPELSPEQKSQVGQLIAASPADFDRLFLQQQLAAHQMAQQLASGYARRGDNATLRQAAQSAVPMISDHLAQVQKMLAAR